MQRGVETPWSRFVVDVEEAVVDYILYHGSTGEIVVHGYQDEVVQFVLRWSAEDMQFGQSVGKMLPVSWGVW